jgi:serine/threonine protein kinase
MKDLSRNEKALFAAARELTDTAQRRAFLDQACTDDPALRRRLEEMLAAQTRAEQFFAEGEIGLGLQAATTSPLTEKPGDRIGRYKLLQKIGEGGCGVVYVAEQEEPVRRRVALKVIKLGMDTRSVVARFEAERQSLAMMDHPNIAKVLDAGSTETGRPYFVMELVRGTRITDYCDENKLPTPQRLELFIKVCLAVQHAHQKSVVHRDLKPSNILVADHDGVPVPKIIDFGIAKATTGQALTDKTLYTAFEQFIGTPAYMSPEQAKLSGLDIDTRSDIYSLGVLLYELLTGQTPFDAKELLEAGIDGIRRLIREVDPPRPSTRLSTLDVAQQTAVARTRLSEPPKLVHLVRGDLDWIVMKTLEKDRNRRYDTALDLAADLQNYLSDKPVKATPPSLLYRSGKLLRRRRKEALVAALLCALLVCAAAFGLQHSRSESLRLSAQLGQWRQQEAQALNQVIAGVALSEPEKQLARTCVQRLAERVRAGLGSEMDHYLLARFLTRDVRLKGRLIQVMDRPSLSVSAWDGTGFPVDGVAAVLRPLATLDGIEVRIGGGDVYISGGRASGPRTGVGEPIHVEQIPVAPGIKNLSCLVEVQLVHAKPGASVATGAHAADYQKIGDPLRIVLPSIDRFFVRQYPPNYPVEIIDEPTARLITDGFEVSSATASMADPQRLACEVEFRLPQTSSPFPIALGVDLLEFAGVPAQTYICGILIDEQDSASVAQSQALQTLGSEVSCSPDKVRYKVKFILPGIKALPQNTESISARFRVRSSHEAALSNETLEHFLSIPELTKEVPVVLTTSASPPGQAFQRR